MLSIRETLASIIFLTLITAQSIIEDLPNLPDSIRKFPSCYNTAVAKSLEQAKCSTNPINRETFSCLCNLPSLPLSEGVVPEVFADINECYLEWYPAWTSACANLPPYGTVSDEDIEEAAGVLSTIIDDGEAGGSSVSATSSSSSPSSSVVAGVTPASSVRSSLAVESTERSTVVEASESASQTVALATAAGSPPANTAGNVPSSTSSGFGAAMATVGIVGPAVAALAMLV